LSQIEHRIGQLAGIHPDVPDRRIDHGFQSNARSQGAVQQFGDFPQLLARGQQAWLQGLLAGKRQQAASQIGAAPSGVHRRVPGSIQVRIVPQPLFQHGQIAQDDGQEVVEIMGDAAGELTDRLQFLRLVQGHLGLPVFGQVLVEHETADHHLVGHRLQAARRVRDEIGAHVPPIDRRVQLVFDMGALAAQRRVHMAEQSPRQGWLQHLAEGAAQKGFSRRPKPFRVFLVDESVTPVGVQVADQHRNGVGDQPDTVLALAQGGGDALALLDFPRQLGVERQQFGGALADPRLQLFVTFAQLRLGPLASGDVLVDGDETAAGDGFAADFQHRPVRAGSFEAATFEPFDPPDPLLDLRLGIAGAVFATPGIEAKQFDEG